MKQIKETEKITTIVLEEGDILKICTKGNFNKIVRVISKSYTLQYDDITIKN